MIKVVFFDKKAEIFPLLRNVSERSIFSTIEKDPHICSIDLLSSHRDKTLEVALDLFYKDDMSMFKSPDLGVFKISSTSKGIQINFLDFPEIDDLTVKFSKNLWFILLDESKKELVKDINNDNLIKYYTHLNNLVISKNKQSSLLSKYAIGLKCLNSRESIKVKHDNSIILVSKNQLVIYR